MDDFVKKKNEINVIYLSQFPSKIPPTILI